MCDQESDLFGRAIVCKAECVQGSVAFAEDAANVIDNLIHRIAVEISERNGPSPSEGPPGTLYLKRSPSELCGSSLVQTFELDCRRARYFTRVQFPTPYLGSALLVCHARVYDLFFSLQLLAILMCGINDATVSDAGGT